jgi:hypothetical protein
MAGFCKAAAGYARRSKSLEALIPMPYLRASRPTTLRRRWRRCLARMPAGCRPQPLLGSRRPGAGVCTLESARSVGKSLCVLWVDGIHVQWHKARWSSSVPRPRARRSSSALIDGVWEGAQSLEGDAARPEATRAHNGEELAAPRRLQPALQG